MSRSLYEIAMEWVPGEDLVPGDVVFGYTSTGGLAGEGPPSDLRSMLYIREFDREYELELSRRARLDVLWADSPDVEELVSSLLIENTTLYLTRARQPLFAEFEMTDPRARC